MCIKNRLRSLQKLSSSCKQCPLPSYYDYRRILATTNIQKTKYARQSRQHDGKEIFSQIKILQVFIMFTPWMRSKTHLKKNV